MQDEVDGIVDDEWLRDVVPQEPEPGVGSQVVEVRGRPRQQVVDPDDMPVSLQEIVAEVRAEEPGGSGDQHGRGGWAADAHTYTRFGSTRRVASPRPGRRCAGSTRRREAGGWARASAPRECRLYPA